MNDKVVLKGTARQYELTEPEIARKMTEGDLCFMDFMVPTACNLDCLKCFSAAARAHDNSLSMRGVSTEDISHEKRDRLINEAIEQGVKTVLVAGVGEPTSSKQLDEIIDICSAREGVNIIFFTNGTYIDRRRTEDYLAKGANIIFSVDALDKNKFDALTGSHGFFDRTYQNLSDALEIATALEEKRNGVRVSRLAVNTTPTLLTYNPSSGVDDLARFRELIDGRVPHLLTRLSPFGNASRNWSILAGTNNYRRNPVLEEAILKYGCGTVGTSARADGTCAALHNGIAVYKGYWMMCPDAGLEINHGRFPELTVKEHWQRKKEFLAKHRERCCIAEINL